MLFLGELPLIFIDVTTSDHGWPMFDGLFPVPLTLVVIMAKSLENRSNSCHISVFCSPKKVALNTTLILFATQIQ